VPENLEEKKYLAEIEKLNIEIDALRRPFSRPLNWVPLLLAAVGIFSAFTQFQHSSVVSERSAFKLEQQKIETEKILAQKTEQLSQKQSELNEANQEKISTEKSTKALRVEQAKLQAALAELNIKITQSKEAAASLDAQLVSDNADQEVKELSQQVSDRLEVAKTSLDETVKQQVERITRLIIGMNEDSKTIRVHSTNSLINEFQSSSRAIEETLALFDDGSIQELSADGRINALIFLGATLPEAWNSELISVARDKIAFIEARQSQGIKIGITTRKWISKLQDLLDSL